jgi:hypothetical protein
MHTASAAAPLFSILQTPCILSLFTQAHSTCSLASNMAKRHRAQHTIQPHFTRQPHFAGKKMPKNASSRKMPALGAQCGRREASFRPAGIHSTLGQANCCPCVCLRVNSASCKSTTRSLKATALHHPCKPSGGVAAGRQPCGWGERLTS